MIFSDVLFEKIIPYEAKKGNMTTSNKNVYNGTELLIVQGIAFQLLWVMEKSSISDSTTASEHVTFRTR